MGFERSCQVKILSKHINSNKKSFSALTTLQPVNINPWFITGFADGESSFIISVVRNNKYKTGWSVKPKFQLALHNKDTGLLLQIQKYFGIGKLYKNGDSSDQFRVESIKELEILINHFDSYGLITQKWSDYQLFKQGIELLTNKEHLTKEGLDKLIAIKASLNLGLSNELKTSSPKVVPVNRPVVPNQNIPDPMWIAGFTSAEGCFLVNIKQSKTISLGYQTILRFQVTQHIRDRLLLTNIRNFLDCGHLHEGENVQFLDIIVHKLSDIQDKIIPFFIKYPILGVKYLDFVDFTKIADLMKDKNHLNQEGLDQIRKIKVGMNKGR